MHRTFRLTFLFLSVALSGILLSCQSSIPPQTRFIMGTVCTINLYEQGTENLYTTAFERLGELESILSANRTDTNVADIRCIFDGSLVTSRFQFLAHSCQC